MGLPACRSAWVLKHADSWGNGVAPLDGSHPRTPTLPFTPLLPHCAACAREHLAPLALGAHPEAYLEFKALLLLLVYDSTPAGGGSSSADGGSTAVAQHPHSRPGAGATPAVREAWAEGTRRALAAQVYQTMRQELGEWAVLYGGRGKQRANL